MIWAILGFSVGIIALFCVSLAEFAAEKPFFESNRAVIATLLCFLGIAFWFIGRFKGRQQTQEVEEHVPEPGWEPETPETHSRLSLFSYQYWGVILVILSASVLFVRPWRTAPKPAMTDPTPLVRLEKPVPTNAPPPKPAPPPEPRPVQFPELKLQGIIYRQNEPAAIINAETYYVGDRVSGAQVVAITRHSVELRMAGVTTLLQLDE